MNTKNDKNVNINRQPARKQRKSPDQLIDHKLVIRPNGDEHWVPAFDNPNNIAKKPPTEICIRLNESADIFHENSIGHEESNWNFADWLEQASEKWAGDKINITFLSFGAFYMTPKLFDYLKIIADKCPNWHSRLFTDGQDLTSTATIDAILRSPLGELKAYVSGLGETKINHRVLDAVKDLVDLRAARCQNHPNIICKLCPHAANTEKLSREMSQWARQVKIDRLEITDNEAEEAKLWGL